MKRITLLIICMVELVAFGQSRCDSIHKMEAEFKCFQTRANKSKSVYCIYLQDTIPGVLISGHQYGFHIAADSYIEAKLSRMWNILRPIWNTFFSTDTVLVVPIGTIKYINRGDTILFDGLRTAYVGPKFLRRKKH